MAERKRRLWPVLTFVLAVSAAAILYGLAADRTIPIRSDSQGVRFVTENDRIQEVRIEGRFPYRKLIPFEEREQVRDEKGSVVEEIRTYTPTAGFSLSRALSLKIETVHSDDLIHTEVIRFADKTVVITDGRVVEDHE